jgi:S-adenosyl methyltransferase
MDAGGLVDLQLDRPHSARIYHHLLGGKDAFKPDREAAAEIVAKMPNLPVSMRANRRFMARVVHHLAGERGIRQFLDIGTGLPVEPNLHEVVQAVDPTARVVYVDNDPIVLVHARALLTGSPEGVTEYIDADLREPEALLASVTAQGTLDFGQPVAVTLIAILQHIVDDDQVHHILDTLLAPLVPGSALALSTVTADSAPVHAPSGIAAYNASGIPTKARDRACVEALFAGLDLVEPGVTLVHRWRPGPQDADVRDEQVTMYGGVAIKPGAGDAQ